MSAEIVSLVPDVVGENFVLEPNLVLEGAVKKSFTQVVVIAFDADGEIHVSSSHSSREALWLIKKGEHHLLFDIA